MNSTSTALARYRLEKAMHNLVGARDAFALGHYDLTVGRCYYAIFTAMRAMLATKKLDGKKHSGVIALFNEHFIQGNHFPRGFYKIITEAKKIREHADYGDFVEVSKETARAHVTNAEKFLARVEEVLRKILMELNGT